MTEEQPKEKGQRHRRPFPIQHCKTAQAALASAPSTPLTVSTTAANEAASSMAMADRVLRSSSMPDLIRPPMKTA
jgi:hypothetical protein